MIEVKGIEKYFGKKRVLQGASFSIEKGILAGLIGPSGSGKSILLKILGGVVQAHAGTVAFGGEVPSRSLMFQEGALFDSLSVFDNVAFPLVDGKVPSERLNPETRDMVVGRVSEILARVGLTHAAHKFPSQISGGMKRRVSLARALVNRPEFLLLDDPTSGLDPVASSVIMELIGEIYREYKPTTIIVSHDLRRLLPIVSRIYALFEGSIVFGGNLRNLALSDDRHLRSFVACRYEFGAPIQSLV